MPPRPQVVLVLLLAAAVVLAPRAEGAEPGTTFLLDRPTGLGTLPFDGANTSLATTQHLISDNGRFVVFESDADQLLAAGADPAVRHVFVRDRTNATTRQVDVRQDGTPGNRGAFDPAISGDGTHVAFVSSSTNLTADTVSGQNIYVVDLGTGAVELASRRTTATGTPGNGADYPSLDLDGSRVAFVSFPSLDAADSNSNDDIYVRDLVGDTTTLISRATAGGAVGNGDSSRPAIDGPGTFVAFQSDATNLDSVHDTNDDTDIYRGTGAVTTLMSRINGLNTDTGNGGSFMPTISTDGVSVAFESSAATLVADDTNGASDVFVRSGTTTTLLSRANGVTTPGDDGSFGASISGDGSRVAFTSSASNLVPGVTGGDDIDHTFVRTTTGNTTLLASQGTGDPGPVALGGTPSVNSDGTKVLFGSRTAALGGAGRDVLDIFVRDTAAATTDVVSIPTGTAVAAGTANSASPGRRAASDDGRYVVFESHADGLGAGEFEQVLLRDALTETTTLVSHAPGGTNDRSSDATISADGSTVAFVSDATNLVGGSPPRGQTYAYDVATGAIALVSQVSGTPSDGSTFFPSVNADGTKIAFVSDGTNLDPAHDTNGQSDVYLRDRTAGTTTLVSRATGADTPAGNGYSQEPSIDAEGRRVAFATDATDLGDGDTTPDTDVHVRDVVANTTVLASRANGAGGAPGDGASLAPAISGDGTKVVFQSSAANLDDGDTTAIRDIHLRDLSAGTTQLVSRVGAAGASGDADSLSPAISRDGSTVAFATGAGNFLSGGPSPFDLLLVRTLADGTTVIGSRADGADGALATAGSFTPSLNADGSCLYFGSRSTGLVPGGYPSPDYQHVYGRVLARECPLVAPETAIDSGPSGKVAVRQVTFAFSSNEAGSTFRCKLDDGAYEACTSPLSLTATVAAHTFSVFATDKAGNRDESPATRAFTVELTGGSQADTVAPVISKASLSRKRFAVGSKATAISAAAKKKRRPAPRGTTVRYTLSEAAAVTLTIHRREPGLRKGKRCVKPTAKLRRAGAKRCTRFVNPRALRRTGKVGANRVAFSGRIGRVPLARGKYRMRIAATDAAKNASAARTLRFTIVKR